MTGREFKSLFAEAKTMVLRSVRRIIRQSCLKKMGAENGSWNNPVLIADKEMVHLIFHQNYEWALQTDRYGMTRTDQEE